LEFNIANDVRNVEIITIIKEKSCDKKISYWAELDKLNFIKNITVTIDSENENCAITYLDGNNIKTFNWRENSKMFQGQNSFIGKVSIIKPLFIARKIACFSFTQYLWTKCCMCRKKWIKKYGGVFFDICNRIITLYIYAENSDLNIACKVVD
jgi:hypothetical protein